MLSIGWKQFVCSSVADIATKIIKPCDRKESNCLGRPCFLRKTETENNISSSSESRHSLYRSPLTDIGNSKENWTWLLGAIVWLQHLAQSFKKSISWVRWHLQVMKLTSLSRGKRMPHRWESTYQRKLEFGLIAICRFQRLLRVEANYFIKLKDNRMETINMGSRVAGRKGNLSYAKRCVVHSARLRWLTFLRNAWLMSFILHTLG